MLSMEVYFRLWLGDFVLDLFLIPVSGHDYNYNVLILILIQAYHVSWLCTTHSASSRKRSGHMFSASPIYIQAKRV